jgi:predicted  nucleic acid-binding Zn-ribbon protein
MAEGRIPVAEALHYAMSLAEALRKLHDAGKAHGSVTPSGILLAGHAVDLIPSLGPSATVTPYAAPEVLQGQPADARSDIFSFGAIVFEMLTGRRAFDGESQTELILALSNAAPPPSGSPAVDRLVNSCVAKSPAARWQRMQKIIMELKLLTVAARRADTPVPARGVSDSALRAEIQQLEARLSLRLANYEKTVGMIQAAAGEAAESLKGQLAAVHAQLAAIEARPVEAPVNVDALMQQIEGRVEQTIAAVSEKLQAQVSEKVEASNQQHSAQVQEAFGTLKQEIAAQVKETVDVANSEHAAKVQESIVAASGEVVAQAKEAAAAVNERMAAAEQNMEEIRKHFATLQENVAGDLHDFEKTMKAQGVAIESARTAMAQTDDLVERVVEALELLQSSMIDQHEAAGVN